MIQDSPSDQGGASLSVKEVMKALNCHENTVWNYLQRGSFPNAWKLGRTWRIPTKDLESFIAARRRFPQETK